MAALVPDGMCYRSGRGGAGRAAQIGPREDAIMKALITWLILLFASSVVLAHGGGCRKDSPPGQCCHMDNSTGIVHCH